MLHTWKLDNPTLSEALQDLEAKSLPYLGGVPHWTSVLVLLYTALHYFLEYRGVDLLPFQRLWKMIVIRLKADFALLLLQGVQFRVCLPGPLCSILQPRCLFPARWKADSEGYGQGLSAKP